MNVLCGDTIIDDIAHRFGMLSTIAHATTTRHTPGPRTAAGFRRDLVLEASRPVCVCTFERPDERSGWDISLRVPSVNAARR